MHPSFPQAPPRCVDSKITCDGKILAAAPVVAESNWEALCHTAIRASGDLFGFLGPRSRLDEKTLDARGEVIEQP
jgi:hypothetical protein